MSFTTPSENDEPEVMSLRDLMKMAADEKGDNTAQETREARTEEELTEAIGQVEGPGNVIVKIHCNLPKEREGWCENLEAKEITLDALRKKWGAGTYTLTFYGPGWKYLKQTRIKIADPLPVASSNAPTMQFPEIPPQLLSLIKPGSDSSLLRELAPILIAAMPVIAQVMAARRVDPMQQMVLMKSLFENKSNSMDEFLKVAEFIKAIEGDKNSANWVDVVRDAIKNAPAIVGGMLSSQRPPIEHQPRVVAGTGPSPTEPAVELSEEWLRDQLKRMIEHAQNDRDPALYADTFIEELPPNFPLGELHANLSNKMWWGYLTMFEPAVKPWKEWFHPFRDEVVRIIEDLQHEQADLATQEPKE